MPPCARRPSKLAKTPASHRRGHTELEAVLELAAKRTRAIVSARTLAIGLAGGDALRIAAAAGEGAADLIGQSLPLNEGVAGAALRSRRPERAAGEFHRARFAQNPLAGLALQPEGALYVPLLLGGNALGALIAYMETLR